MKLVEHNANWVCKIMKLSLHFYEFHSIGLLLQVQIAPPQFASLSTPSIKFWPLNTKGLFTPESRAVTMKLWESKRKCPKALPTHLQNHVVWSQTLKCSVKSYVTRSSTKSYFNGSKFMRVLAHDKITKQQLWTFRVRWSPNRFVLRLPPRSGSWK